MGDRILAEYKLSDDFFNFRTEHSFNLGVFANIISEDGEVMEGYSYRRFDGADGKMHREDDFRVQMTERFIDSISKADSVSYIEKNPNDGAQFAVYGAYLGKIDGKKMYLRLSSPVERTDTTRRVLQSQLAVVTVISVLLASVLAYFIARRLSKPIEKITDSAQKLAKGDYGIAFESGTYREINELAQTLNRTSEELSKTEGTEKGLDFQHQPRFAHTAYNHKVVCGDDKRYFRLKRGKEKCPHRSYHRRNKPPVTARERPLGSFQNSVRHGDYEQSAV